ncbi:MAG TPA: ATP-binding protein [Candidatus Borkfalkia faecavium]|uniref:ATP-binding protein n=1 Tax=Candidatus Borkfalkia faecavium TaxID=2838508 RepID=A0A9D1W1J6_9FIRM|nr:ATP-binding protein [Candidatus Borkfalkia faecavium]
MNVYGMILVGQLNFFYEILIPLFLMMRRQERRRLFWLRIAAVAVLSAGLYFVPFIPVGPFGLHYLICLVLAFAAGVFCFRLPILDILFYTVAAFAVQHALWDILHMIYEGIGPSITPWQARLIYAGVYVCGYLIFYLFFPVSDKVGMGRKERGFELIISACTFAITYVLASFVPVVDEWNFLYRCYALLCCALVLFLQFGVFERRAQRVLARKNEQDKVVLEEILSRERRQYAYSKEAIDLINIKCHDLKHQIAALRNLSAEGRDHSIADIEKAVMIYGNIAKTGNETLDAILTEKSFLCEKYGIRFTYMIDGESLAFMQPVDIASLFGNALDNAIESVLREEDTEHRVIRLNASVKRRFLSIRLENYCGTPVRFEDGLPVTVKHDKEYHGYGVKSIRLIVERYGGTLHMHQDDCLFELDIILPAADPAPAAA